MNARISRRAILLGGGSLPVLRADALPDPPPLTVLLVLEQFRLDYLTPVREQLGANGIRRLLEGGAFYPGCRHLASSFTASTLATLATGVYPAQHGIVADIWYEHSAQRAVRASDEALQADTLLARVAAFPSARVYVTAMDASAARLVSNTPAARLYWMDERGQMTARGEQPDWLAAYNRQRPLEEMHDAHWTAMGARAGAPPLRKLTWDAAHPEEFRALYQASPFADMAQFGFLRELVAREKLGQGKTTDLVCLLLGASERLGYEAGAGSPLMGQMALHLDRHIEFLFETLTRGVGEGRFNIVLATGHGAPQEPLPEARARMAVSGETLAGDVQRALGGIAKVEKYVYPFLYLDSGGRDPEIARRAAVRALEVRPGVAATYLPGGGSNVPPRWVERFRNSFHPRRSGDVMVSYRPDYVEEYGAQRGVSYGSLYNYDIAAPVCFWGPQFRAVTIEDAVESIDVAPTLARAFGVAPPGLASGAVLGEAFAGNVKSKR